MNRREFYELVVKLRHAQKEYFKCRDRNSLRQSIIYENQVDAEIERVNKILDQQKS